MMAGIYDTSQQGCAHRMKLCSRTTTDQEQAAIGVVPALQRDDVKGGDPLTPLSCIKANHTP
jgi:hypothetical protein